jgi:hypothetical protein
MGNYAPAIYTNLAEKRSAGTITPGMKDHPKGAHGWLKKQLDPIKDKIIMLQGNHDYTVERLGQTAG